MRIWHHYRDLPADATGAVAAIGNFDGVHRGHRAVIEAAIARARKLERAAAAITFEPHPRRFFTPDAPPFRLTPARAKERRLAELGIGSLFVLPFDRPLSQLSAAEFVDRVLRHGLALSHVVVGEDFVFGHRRGGNVALLRELAAPHGLGLTVVGRVGDDGDAFSSSRIREKLAAGDPLTAARWLGRWWEIEGPVVAGDRRGRDLGYPTANIDTGEFLIPKLGIYAVRAAIDDGQSPIWRDAVASVGRRPTFGGGAVKLEVHLLDFAGALYGRCLRVAFISYLRDEWVFDSAAALRQQIGADVAETRRVLALPANCQAGLGARDTTGARSP